MVIKILVLEDNDNLLLNYQIMFEYNNNNNYAVKLVKSSIQALSLLKNNFLPDVVLSETRVNGTDGFQFYELLANNYIWQNIPFIFVTSY